MSHVLRRAGAAAVLLFCFGSFATMPARAADADDATSYVGSVRAALDRGKRFPTGREVSLEQPSGRSEVTFSLTRRGKVAAARTTKSSNSTPLDDMAKTLVRRAKYPAFPANAWSGEPTHSFVVTYNFDRNPTGKVTVGEPVEVRAE